MQQPRRRWIVASDGRSRSATKRNHLHRSLWPVVVAMVVVVAAAVVLLVPVAGQAGAPPRLAWSPATNGGYEYGVVDAAQTASQTFTLTNSGGSTSARLTVARSGSSAFTVRADGCSGRRLGPRRSCTVSVLFAPDGASSVQATLTVTGETASAALAVTGSGGVGGHVYWTSHTTSSIGCANLDGTGANQRFITGASGPGVAVDAGYLYWTNYTTSSIGRANLDGTGGDQSFITGASGPVGVAVDAGHVYWTNQKTGTIGRANLDGTGADQSFITGATGRVGVAVDAAHVYWTNNYTGTIGRANLDGTGADQSFIAGASGLIGVAVDAGHVYWTNNNAGTIGRANLDGTGVDQSFITGASQPFGLAVDPGPPPLGRTVPERRRRASRLAAALRGLWSVLAQGTERRWHHPFSLTATLRDAANEEGPLTRAFPLTGTIRSGGFGGPGCRGRKPQGRSQGRPPMRRARRLAILVCERRSSSMPHPEENHQRAKGAQSHAAATRTTEARR